MYYFHGLAGDQSAADIDSQLDDICFLVRILDHLLQGMQQFHPEINIPAIAVRYVAQILTRNNVGACIQLPHHYVLLNQLFHLLLVMRRDALLRDGLREQKVCFILTSGDRNFFEDRPLEISSRKLPLNFKDTAIAALTELPYKGPSRPDSVQFRLCHVHQSFLFYPASTHITGRTVPPESVKFARCRLGMDARSTKYPSRNHHQHVPPY